MELEDLVEVAALALYNRRRIEWKMKPVDHIGANNTPQVNAIRAELREIIPLILSAASRESRSAAERS